MVPIALDSCLCAFDWQYSCIKQNKQRNFWHLYLQINDYSPNLAMLLHATKCPYKKKQSCKTTQVRDSKKFVKVQ